MHLDFDFNKKIQDRAAHIIAQRVYPLSLVNIVLYIALVLAATQAPKNPQFTWSIGLGFVLAAALIVGCSRLFKTSRLLPQRRRLLFSSILLLGCVWGAVGALTHYNIALGWTPFFVTLMLIFVSASFLPALLPDFYLQVAFQALILVPSSVINLFLVGGFQGLALGLFLLGFLSISLATGFLLFRQFWRFMRDHERLQAMFDAMPGTLAWVQSNGEIMDTNRPMEDLLSDQSLKEEFVEAFDQFVQRIFDSDGKTASGLISFAKKMYFMSGSRYNFNDEGIVLGVDVSDLHLIQSQLEFQRTQSQNSARWATVGEVIGDLMGSLPEHFEEGREQVAEVWPLLHRLSTSQTHSQKREFSLRSCVEAVERFYRQKLRAEKVSFTTTFPERDIRVCGSTEDIILALLAVVNNAFGAIEDGAEKAISISVQETPGGGEIHVTDSGPGVSDYLREVIFEPNFTTKKPHESTGLGLSLAKQLVAAHGGTLQVDKEQPTRFIMSLKRAADRIETEAT